MKLQLPQEQIDYLNNRAKEFQQEKYEQYGHQEWYRVTVLDFGNDNIEVSVMPYETWAEPPPELELKEKSARGEGDREKSIESASRRARRAVRHKCKLLKVQYMVTLTTKAIITDQAVMQRYLQEFVRRIRKVSDFEYVAVLEYQQRGALHIHLAVEKKQDYKLLWSIWFSIVGKDQGRVHVTTKRKGNDTNRIASYISKYLTKSFETGELNKKRYWASKGIGKPIKETRLIRQDRGFSDVLMYIIEVCNGKNIRFDLSCNWQNIKKGLLWIAISSRN